MIFSVWAPKPDRVDLVLGERRVAMERDDAGTWRAQVSDAGPGTEYAFSLDGGPPRPDPRSAYQAHGVHGPSRVVDHASHAWQVEGFRAPPLSAAIIEEIHVGTFTREGTFDAAIPRLDHLADVGITHVELMPINAFDGRHGWGYDGVAWFAPHAPYCGPDGPDAVRRFVDACHARGLAVLLDVVYNHLGPSGNYLPEFAPYFNDAYHTPWGPAINLDGPDSDVVRRFILDNVEMWLRDYRFDGLRLDAVHAYQDRTAVPLLEEMGRTARRLEAETGRPLVLIAESDLNDPRMVREPAVGGLGIDAQWNDDFHHALHVAFTGEQEGWYVDYGDVAHLAKAWRDAFVHDGCHAGHRRRRHGRPATGLPGHRFLAYAQNHDQIGNRARGERLSMLLDVEALEAIAALVLLGPFVPMLFQGEEWGSGRPFRYFTDFDDADLAEAVRSGRRREFAAFGWDPEEVPDPQDPETREASCLDWDEPSRAPHDRILDWHRRLVMLRRGHPDLVAPPVGSLEVLHSEDPPRLASTRGGLRLAFNLGPERVTVPLPGAPLDRPRILLTNDDGAELTRDGSGVALAGPGVAVIESAPRDDSVR